MFNLDFNQIAINSKQALEQIHEKPNYQQKVFSESTFKDKIKADMVFMEYLIENYLSKDYYELVESIYTKLGSVAQDIDTNIHTNYTQDKLKISLLTEAEILDNYKFKLTNEINNKFTKELIKGSLVESHKDELNFMFSILAESNVISDIDIELISKYAIFESEIYNAIKKIVIPELFQEAVNYKLETTEEDYFAIFDNNFKVNYEILESNIYDFVVQSGMAIKMFNESSEDVKISPKYKGISKLLQKQS
jgi:hypothetical protein